MILGLALVFAGFPQVVACEVKRAKLAVRPVVGVLLQGSEWVHNFDVAKLLSLLARVLRESLHCWGKLLASRLGPAEFANVSALSDDFLSLSTLNLAPSLQYLVLPSRLLTKETLIVTC